MSCRVNVTYFNKKNNIQTLLSGEKIKMPLNQRGKNNKRRGGDLNSQIREETGLAIQRSFLHTY